MVVGQHKGLPEVSSPEFKRLLHVFSPGFRHGTGRKLHLARDETSPGSTNNQGEGKGNEGLYKGVIFKEEPQNLY